MSKSKKFFVNLIIFILVILPFFLSYLLVTSMGFSAFEDKDILSFTVLYLLFFTLLESLPLAIATYYYGDFDHMNFSTGTGSDSTLELFIIGGAFILLFGKKISALFLGKSYYKNAKGKFFPSIYSGILMSVLSTLTFSIIIGGGIFIYLAFSNTK